MYIPGMKNTILVDSVHLKGIMSSGAPLVSAIAGRIASSKWRSTRLEIGGMISKHESCVEP